MILIAVPDGVRASRRLTACHKFVFGPCLVELPHSLEEIKNFITHSPPCPYKVHRLLDSVRTRIGSGPSLRGPARDRAFLIRWFERVDVFAPASRCGKRRAA